MKILLGISALLLSTASSATVLFSDDFESGLSKWTVYSVDQNPYIETNVTGSDGNQTSVLNTADTNFNHGGVASTNQTFDFIGNNLTFTGDIQRLNGQGVGGLFLRNKSNDANLVHLSMNNDHSWPNGFSWKVMVEDQGNQSIESGLFSVNISAWHNIGASIDPSTNIVSILLDDTVIAETNNPIFGNSSDQAYVMAGSRLARYDNIKVQAIISNVPEPTTLALMTLGLAGVGFARKKRQS